MAVSVDQLILQIQTDFKTQGITVGTDELKKFIAATGQTDQAVQNLNTKITAAQLAFERKSKAVNNARDSILRAQTAFAGFGGTLGEVGSHVIEFNNQMENFQFAAHKAGKSIDVFTASVGELSGALGNLATASIILAVFLKAIEIGTKLREVFKLDSIFQKNAESAQSFADALSKGGGPLTAAMYLLEKLTGVTKQQEQNLSDLNEKLKQQLWDKYGIAVDTAGLSVEQASVKILAAAHNVNIANMALAGAIKDIATAAAEANKKMEESLMAPDILRQRLINQVQQLNQQMEAASKAHNIVMIEQIKAQIIAVNNQIAQLTGQIYKDEQQKADAAAKAATEAAKRSAQEIQKAFEAAIKAGPKELGFAFDALTDKITADQKAIEAWKKALGLVTAGSMEDLQQHLDLLAPAVDKTVEALNKIPPIIETAKQKADELANTLAGWGDTLNKISHMFEGTTGGDLFGLAGAGLDKMAQAAHDGLSGMQLLGPLIGGITNKMIEMGGKWEAWGNIAQGATKIVVGIMSGDLLSVIQGVMQAMAGLIKLFQKDWPDAVRQSLANTFGILGISDELLKRIADDAKKLNDQELAIVLHMRELMDETGVTAQNIAQYLGMASAVLSDFQRGLLTAAQATDILNSTFADLAAAAEKFGGVYMTQLKQLIANTNALGLSVQAMTDYVKAAFADATTALSAMVDSFAAKVDRFYNKFKGVSGGDAIGIPANLARGFEGLASMFLQQFNAMEAAGMSFNEIMQQLGPTFEKLETMAKQLGLTGSQAFQDLSGIWDALKDDKGALNHVQNLLQWITAMDKVTGITEQEFNKLQHTTTNTFNKLTKDIQSHLHNHQKASDAALRQMLPELIEIMKLHDEYGYKIDKNTQKLIDQAKAEGLIKPDPMQTLIDVMTHMDATLTQIAETFGVATDAALGFSDALNGIPSDVSVNVDYTQTAPGGSSSWQHHLRNPSFDSLSEPIMFTRKQTINVDPGETLLPSAKNASSTSGGSVSPNIYQTNHFTINLNGYNDQSVVGVIQNAIRDRRLVVDTSVIANMR